MEEYEKFCEKHLARIQGEFMENEISPVAQHKNISLIRFNGVPMLSPLLTLEKKKELEQDRQKALDLERWQQNSKQRILLTRVEEIVANVQMKNMSNQSDLDQSEKENIHLDLDSKVLNGPTTESCNVLPKSTAFSECVEPKQIPDVKPMDIQVASDGNADQFVPYNPMETCSSHLEKSIVPEGQFSSLPSTSSEIVKKDSTDPGLVAVESPDPYVMSLQNLLKKSREYIQREQTRRSLRNSSKKNNNGSHPDKENNAVKMNELGKERGKLMGRSTAVPALEKSSLIKPSASPQSSSVSKNNARGIASSSFSKVDIPMRCGTPPVLDSDSDEDFRNVSLFERDSILRNFTGSYSKLPSPESSMSPKMHRRRPRPSSIGHIVITNPVNAYELSPKEKGGTAELIVQDGSERQTASDPMPNLSTDSVPLCPRKAQSFGKSSSDTFNGLVVGKCNEVCQLPTNHQETGNFPAHPTIQGESMLENGKASSDCLSNFTRQELQDGSCSLLTQNPTKTLPDKVKGSVAMELNKSYDVECPSPLLLQMQSKPSLDSSEVTFGNEQILENELEKIKCRLDLDVDSVQKENMPWVVSTEVDVPERRCSHDQRYSARAVLEAKHETPARCLREEEALKQKMRALAELRQKLEEQHAQQLSLLIAEQEREQERLQKEIEEQARRLKEEKNSAESGIPEIDIGSGVALEWRKISDTNLLESVLTRVEAVHGMNLESAGFVTAALPAGSPFYLWEQPASGKLVSVSRSINRNKMRWSQVYSPEMKRKLNKISALAKGFLTRRLLQTEKLKHLRQTVHDTMEFIRNFQSEALLKRGNVPAQDANLQERVVAQLQAALYDIHDIFFKMEASERMNILRQDREIRKEKMLRQLDKTKSPRDRVTLSTATQKSLDRKKYIKAAEMGIPNKKTIGRQKIFENRVLQPNQGQNAPIQRLLFRQGTPKTSMVEQNRKKPSDNRVPNKAFSGVCVGRIQRKKPNVATT